MKKTLELKIKSIGVLFLLSFSLHFLLALWCSRGNLFPGANLLQMFFAICLVEAMIAGVFFGFHNFLSDDESEENFPIYTVSAVVLGGIIGLSFMTSPLMEGSTGQMVPTLFMGLTLAGLFSVIAGFISIILGFLYSWVMDNIISAVFKLLRSKVKKFMPSLR